MAEDFVQNLWGSKEKKANTDGRNLDYARWNGAAEVLPEFIPAGSNAPLVNTVPPPPPMTPPGQDAPAPMTFTPPGQAAPPMQFAPPGQDALLSSIAPPGMAAAAAGLGNAQPPAPKQASPDVPVAESFNDLEEIHDFIRKTTDPRKLSGKLVDMVIANRRHSMELLLEAGASPTMRPYNDGTAILFRERVPRTALDHACFRGHLESAKILLEHVDCDALTPEEKAKTIEMAAFSCDIDTLMHMVGLFGNDASLAHAMAFAINQGFGEGAMFLWDQGAMQDVDSWYELAQSFRPFMLHYINMVARPEFDTGDDFYSYIFEMPGIEQLFVSQSVQAATSMQRRGGLKLLADQGFLTLPIYREMALRALIFDECDLLQFLGDISGFNFQETFADQTEEQIVKWIRPRISKEKVEIIASMLPPGYSFPFNPRYLTTPQDVQAILPHVTAATCEYPEALVEYCVKMGLNDELAMCIDWGGVTPENVDGLIKEGQKRFQTNAVATLMEYKKTHFETNAMSSLLGALDDL